MSRMSRRFYAILFFLLTLCAALVSASHVSQSITPEDEHYIHKALADAGYDFNALPHEGFEEQVKTIRAVQDAVLKQTPEQQIIPLEESREPRDLYGRGYALCGDRSRFMSKALRLLGFKTRQASLYDSSTVRSPLRAILTTDKSKVRSHALIEVKTERGWMMVDSVTRWIALSAQGDIYDLEFWQNHPNKGAVKWSTKQSGQIYPLLRNNFTYVYGLYSRHGKFYSPYIPVPDIGWREMLYNF